MFSPVHSPAVHHNQDGRLEVFSIGTDEALWHIWQRDPNDSLSIWHSLGGNFLGSPVVHHNQDGRLEVFAKRMDDNTLWHISQKIQNARTHNGWSDWDSLGGNFIGSPVVHHNQDGRLEVFAKRMDDNTLGHISQNIRNTRTHNGWSNWANSRTIMGPGINVILVGVEDFTSIDRSNILNAIQTARSIYQQVDFSIGVLVPLIELPNALVGNFRTINSDAEAQDLTHFITVDNNNIDVFFVKLYVGTAGGSTCLNGPCDKSAKGFSGVVVEVQSTGALTGVVLAHEIGHYLGLNHFCESCDNFMAQFGEITHTNITIRQRDVMSRHCFVKVIG